MKYLPFIFRNLFRKKIRTILTIGSIVVALFLYGLLVTIDSALNAGIEVAGVDRLAVRSKVSLIILLPLSYWERLRQIDHVTEVTHATWFGGIYINERNFFPKFAIDPESWKATYPEYRVADSQWNAFLGDREGAVVGRSLSDRFGWSIGDRIPIQGDIWQGNWAFNIRAIYDGENRSTDESQFWFHWDLLEESRAYEKGKVGWYIVRVDDPEFSLAVSELIDDRFANSAFETVSETEAAFQAGFVNQMGNIRLIIITVGAVVLFTLLLVTGNTMAMAVRERIPELGVLKTLGFGDRTVLFLVLSESLVISLVGGILGVVLAKLFTMGGDPTGGMLPMFYLSPGDMFWGIAIAVFVGLAAGLIPALTAMNLRIVDALRRV